MPKKQFKYEDRVHNVNENEKARHKAIEHARERLAREGVIYPMFDSNRPVEQYYEAIRHYGELESRYMLEYLKMPSGPRPIIEYAPYKD